MLSFLIRWVLLWLMVPLRGVNPMTCERVWDMSPSSTLPPGKTYEEWYGSPELLCDKPGSQSHSFMLCLGSNC